MSSSSARRTFHSPWDTLAIRRLPRSPRRSIRASSVSLRQGKSPPRPPPGTTSAMPCGRVSVTFTTTFRACSPQARKRFSKKREAEKLTDGIVSLSAWLAELVPRRGTAILYIYPPLERRAHPMPLKTVSGKHADPRKGRGAGINPEGRFEKEQREAFDDGWNTPEEELPPLKTHVTIERVKSIISRNDSPDVGFTQSINPYQGCEHGCVYCYARPSHAYRNLSPGIDFETRLFAKVNAAEELREELARPGYRPQGISVGADTDPYQPIEREWKVTRGVLEVLAECNHPVGIVTKNAMVERDLDLLVP